VRDRVTWKQNATSAASVAWPELVANHLNSERCRPSSVAVATNRDA
jgi:hypothetical protein